MITVSHLSKKYPGRLAVQDISFEVNPHEIVGFLGPNGSGKSTTMRMLCGYLAPSGGTARVSGYDVTRFPMEVRKRIGYLPENCPLYPELRVDEYLYFRAALKGVPSRRRHARVNEVKELCGLGDTGRRIIGHLSKGYRQRVGLAEALVHDPELLILDEPTIGLDPIQMRQVRELIRALAERHTVLLSTHILSEVEAVCGRLLIIKEGRLVAQGETQSLLRRMKGAARITAEIKAPRIEIEQELAAWNDVDQITCETDGAWQILGLSASSAVPVRERIHELAIRRGWMLRELHREGARLEDLFVALTQSTGGETGTR